MANIKKEREEKFSNLEKKLEEFEKAFVEASDAIDRESMNKETKKMLEAGSWTIIIHINDLKRDIRAYKQYF